MGGEHRRQGADSYLPRDCRPDLECVVVRATDDAVTAELEACDDVVVMTLQHLGVGRGERIDGEGVGQRHKMVINGRLTKLRSTRRPHGCGHERQVVLCAGGVHFNA